MLSAAAIILSVLFITFALDSSYRNVPLSAAVRHHPPSPERPNPQPEPVALAVRTIPGERDVPRNGGFASVKARDRRGPTTLVSVIAESISELGIVLREPLALLFPPPEPLPEPEEAFETAKLGLRPEWPTERWSKHASPLDDFTPQPIPGALPAIPEGLSLAEVEERERHGPTQLAQMGIFEAMMETWGIPEVRYGGTIGYSFQTNKTGQQIRKYVNTLSTALNADTYVWQPWFITVSGTLNLDLTQRTGEETSDEAGTLTSNTALATSGSLALGVLPLSRYPVTINYTRTNSETSGDQETTGFTSDVLELISSYQYDRTLDLQGRFVGRASSDVAGSTSDGLTLEFRADKRFENQTLNVQLRHSDSSSTSTDNSETTSQSNLLSVRHRYVPWENVTYDNTSTLLFSEGEADTETSEDFSMQATSSLIWQPPEWPLVVNAVWRSLTQESEGTTETSGVTSTSESSVTSFNGRVAANYRHSPQMIFNASVGANYSNSEVEETGANSDAISTDSEADNGDNSILGFDVTLGGSYSSLTKRVLDFDWQWATNAAVSADMSTGTATTTATQQSVGFNQNAIRTINIPLFSPTNLTVGQQVTASNDGTGSLNLGIGHNVRLNHSLSEGNQSTFIGVTATDTRSLGSQTTATQLFNTQLTKEISTSRSTTWSASLTLQASRTESSGEGSGGWETFTSGSLRFQHSNLLSLRGLNFMAELELENQGLLPVSFQTLSETGSTDEDIRWRRRFRSALEYRVGQLMLQLEGRLTQDETGDLADFMVFRATRAF